MDESSPADIAVELTPSRAWDGAAKEAPDGAGTQAAPYQIESGEQLAWLADTVSAGSGAKICAVLTDDIDLGGFPFAPIGVSSHELSGSFDGQGHTVSGLNVSAQYAGLFGVIKDAEIRNVVVQGTVASTSSGSGDAGGIAGAPSARQTSLKTAAMRPTSPAAATSAASSAIPRTITRP